MRKLLFIFFILSVVASNNAFAQKGKNDVKTVTAIPKDSITGKFKYEELIKADGISQMDIYERAKNWIVRTLKSSDNVVNLDDENKAQITATGNILLHDQIGFCAFTDLVLNFKYSVYCKEGRYKVIVDNFILSYKVDCANGKELRTSPLESVSEKRVGVVMGQKSYEKVNTEVDERIKELISSLKNSISSGNVAGDQGDW